MMDLFVLLISISYVIGAAGKTAYGPFTDGKRGKFESICGFKDDSVEAVCHKSSDPAIYETSKAVLRVSRRGRSHCTAWLVGDQGHILTNWHCAETGYDLYGLHFEAMAEGETCSSSCKQPMSCAGKIIDTEQVSFIATGGSMEYDYTLLQLAEADRASAVEKYGFLKLRRSGAVIGEEIYIPQHPAGWGNRIAKSDGIRPAKITRTNVYDSQCGSSQIGYRADTQGGSSGSPVLAVSDNTVVALHHCGGCDKYQSSFNTAVNIDRVIQGLEDYLPDSALDSPKPPKPLNNGSDDDDSSDSYDSSSQHNQVTTIGLFFIVILVVLLNY